MSSTGYLVWMLAMAVLIPAIVLGGTTWAYFRGAKVRSASARVDGLGSVPMTEWRRAAGRAGRAHHAPHLPE